MKGSTSILKPRNEPEVKNKLPTIDASIHHIQPTKDEIVAESNSKEVQTTKSVLKPVPVPADSVNNHHNNLLQM